MHYIGIQCVTMECDVLQTVEVIMTNFFFLSDSYVHCLNMC